MDLKGPKIVAAEPPEVTWEAQDPRVAQAMKERRKQEAETRRIEIVQRFKVTAAVTLATIILFVVMWKHNPDDFWVQFMSNYSFGLGPRSVWMVLGFQWLTVPLVGGGLAEEAAQDHGVLVKNSAQVSLSVGDLRFFGWILYAAAVFVTVVFI